MLNENERDRFWAKVELSNDPASCWNWTANRTSDGYGRFKMKVGGEHKKP